MWPYYGAPAEMGNSGDSIWTSLSSFSWFKRAQTNWYRYINPSLVKIYKFLKIVGIEKSAATLAVAITILTVSLTLTAQTKHTFRVFADQKRVVQLFVDGKKRSVVTNSNTVKAILEENGVDIKPGDIVEPGNDAIVDQPNYNINVYRALPAVVVDNGKFTQVVTGYRTARKIAAAANVRLYPEDTAVLEQVKDFEPTKTLGYKVTINRAKAVQLIINGQPVSLRSHSDTVGELLKDKQITYEASDLQGLTPDSKIVNGLRVVISKLSQETVTVIEDIEPGTQVSYDANLAPGTDQVKRQGLTGRKQVTYLIDKSAGQETKRTIIDSTILTAATDRIVVRGSGIPNASDAVKLGQQMAAARGWTGSQWDALYILWMHESHWNPNSSNTSSGACGIPQALPCSKITDKSTAGQINWGLNYIAGRYGTPAAALNFWNSHNYY